MEIFNGDDFIFNYSCILDDKSIYEFKKDDKLKIIIYDHRKENHIINEVIFDKNTSEINIHISSSEMKKLEPGFHVLEIKLLSKGDTYTTSQEKIVIKESWVLNE